LQALIKGEADENTVSRRLEGRAKFIGK